MATENAGDRDRLSERERQILGHLEQAQSLGVPLTEYASAYEVDVRDLYAGKAALVKKGILSRAVAVEKSDFVPVRISSRGASAIACRVSHPSGWMIEVAQLPEVAWATALMRGAVDDPT
ncbi:MAG: hypothetical protein JSR36_07515 [Proteobacteria bacterium]|nr:hypothetical protein [Pseudomonadota bacterium]